jgi:hypothetical protein
MGIHSGLPVLSLVGLGGDQQSRLKLDFNVGWEQIS